MDNMPILDGFYNSPCFLTAEKSEGEHMRFAKEYVKKHNISTAILVFNKNINKTLFKGIKKIGEIRSGEDTRPIYAYKGVLIVAPFVGSANASAIMEELNVLGLKNYIAAGSAGLIDTNLDESKLLVVNRAIRDEGSSYFYAPPALYASTSPQLTNAITNTLKSQNIPFEIGTTWTVECFYKESKARIEKRRKQGAVAVEMECATWCAVAEHLGVNFGQILYFSDKVINEDWNRNKIGRDNVDLKNKITLLCVEISKNL